jgi:4-amino-4-deoxy-L-arabinose transferase-like glycosyltransferase
MQQAATRVSWKEIAFDGTRTPVKTFLFVLVCLAWVLPGLTGHDPWKPDEAVSFGFIYHILQSGNWSVPMLAGETFLNQPPLYSMVAALFAKTFDWLLPLHDAARLATGFFMVLTLLFTAMASRALHGHRFGRLAVLILIGCLGLVVRGHEMHSDIALLAGYAIAFFGFAKSRISGFVGGAAIGTGIGMAFLSKGPAAVIAIGATAIALPILFHAWRTPRTLQAWAVALVAALPWFTLWPLALYKRSPDLFTQWLAQYNGARFFDAAGSFNILHNIASYLEMLPWYAWPALPLAAWTLWAHGRKGLHYPSLQMPLAAFGITLLVFGITLPSSDVHALPLLIPLALLAAAGIDHLRRGAAGAFDWFGLMTFGILATALWLYYFALFSGHPERMARKIAEYQPGFTPQFHGLAFLLALALTAIWLLVVWRTRQSNRRAIVNWAAGMTMFWLLAMALWLPYIDHGRSYRKVFGDLKTAMPAQAGCVEGRDLGDAQRALLQYHNGLLVQSQKSAKGKNCPLLLVQGSPKQSITAQPGWKKIWEGSRPGDRHERFWLYQRN